MEDVQLNYYVDCHAHLSAEEFKNVSCVYYIDKGISYYSMKKTDNLKA